MASAKKIADKVKSTATLSEDARNAEIKAKIEEAFMGKVRINVATAAINPVLKFGVRSNDRKVNMSQATALMNNMRSQGIWRDDGRTVIKIPINPELVHIDKLGKKEDKIATLPYLKDCAKSKILEVQPFSGQHRVTALNLLLEKLANDIDKLSLQLADYQKELEERTTLLEEVEKRADQSTEKGRGELADAQEAVEAVQVKVDAVQRDISLAKGLIDEGTDWVFEVFNESECFPFSVN